MLDRVVMATSWENRHRKKYEKIRFGVSWIAYLLSNTNSLRSFKILESGIGNVSYALHRILDICLVKKHYDILTREILYFHFHFWIFFSQFHYSNLNKFFFFACNKTYSVGQCRQRGHYPKDVWIILVLSTFCAQLFLVLNSWRESLWRLIYEENFLHCTYTCTIKPTTKFEFP